MRLVSFDLCPFVQRSVITLEEKGVSYDIEYIDLAAKPDWFLAISPFGKVPLLRVDDTVLFESAVINEYLDETQGEPLHPSDPLRRALNRAWIEVASSLVMQCYGLSMAPDEDRARALAADVRATLGRFEEQLGEGPFFNGEAFSLVDAAAAPALQRLDWLEAIRPLGLTDGLEKVRAWSEALLTRASVARSLVPEAQAKFSEYLAGRGSPARRAEPSWFGVAVGA